MNGEELNTKDLLMGHILLAVYIYKSSQFQYRRVSLQQHRNVKIKKQPGHRENNY